jgi:hypothetical protein
MPWTQGIAGGSLYLGGAVRSRRDDCDILALVSALSAGAIEQMRTLESLKQNELRARPRPASAPRFNETLRSLSSGVRHFSEVAKAKEQNSSEALIL